jgi:hypothetical protein
MTDLASQVDGLRQQMLAARNKVALLVQRLRGPDTDSPN